MFVGKYYNSIDSKSRIIVPAKFREELGGRCVVAKSLDEVPHHLSRENNGRNALRTSWTMLPTEKPAGRES